MAAFRKDLFISCAHIDNQPLTPEQKGWISRFHATLEALLSMRLGQAAKIWRDDNNASHIGIRWRRRYGQLRAARGW